MRQLFRLWTWIALAACCFMLSPAAAQTTRQPVTSENADKLTQIGQLGRGTANSLAWSPDGNTLAVSGSTGIALYDAHNLDAEPRTLTGHTAIVYASVFSPDGTLIASASADNSVRLWDVKTGETRFVLKGHTDAVVTVAFSPDGTTLASGGQDSTLHLWDVKTGTQSGTLGANAAVHSLAFSPDGAFLVAAVSDNTLRLWTLKTGKQRAILTGHQGIVESVVYSLDGKLIASGGADHSIRLWDAKTGAPLGILNGHMLSVFSLAFSPSGHTLAAGAEDGRIWLWDVESRTERRVLRHNGSILSVAFSPDGSTLAACSSDSTINLWNPTNGEVRADLKGQYAKFQRLIFAANNRTLLAITADYKVQRWDIESQKSVSTAKQLPGATYIYYSPDRSAFVTGGTYSGKTIAHVLETASDKERALIERSTTFSGFNVAFSNDSKLIAIANYEPAVSVWDAATGAERGILKVPVESGLVDEPYSVLFSPDDKTVVALGIRHKKDNSDRRYVLYQWTLSLGDTKPPIELPNVIEAVFGRDNKTVLLASSSNQIQALDIETGTLHALADLKQVVIHGLAISPDAATLVVFGTDSSTNKSSVTLLDAVTGKEISRLAFDNAGQSTYFIFSPNSQVFAFSEKTVVHVWDVKTGVEKALLKGHTAHVYDVDFTPDGTILASASDDGTIRLWGVK